MAVATATLLGTILVATCFVSIATSSVAFNEVVVHGEACSDLATNDSPPHPSSFAAGIVGLQGNVSDCCCTFYDIEKANNDTIRPLLQRIVSTDFFAHFRIDLCSDCPLWSDLQPFCVMQDCSVCECDEPPPWAIVPTDCTPHSYMSEQSLALQLDSKLDSTTVSLITESSTVLSQLQSPSSGSSAVEDGVVVDLRLNPERYTGYDGESAERVWGTIHSENCFQLQPQQNDDMNSADSYCLLPTEQRLYNRLISGLHSSISLHIAHSYCVEMDPEKIGECRLWGPNAALAKERVLSHSDRLENLYFAFSILLRAVVKAGQAVTAAVPPIEDDTNASSYDIVHWTDTLLPELTRLENSCPRTFDEASVLDQMSGPGSDMVQAELHRRFRHLQQIMHCVGCDRCKLWGTLQALGVGTALRVLFHEDDVGNPPGLSLSRQEAVALVHTLERFSSALTYAHEFLNKP